MTNSSSPKRRSSSRPGRTTPRSVEVTFAIAPGYYLYREQFKFAANGATLGTPAIPPGKVKYDETFQKDVETYRNAITIVVPVAAGRRRIPPRRHQPGLRRRGPVLSADAERGGDRPGRLRRRRHGARRAAGLVASGGTSLAATSASHRGRQRNRPGIDAVLRGGSFWPIVGAFFIAGLLLSLTPCVLPMLPIVSSIIVGQAGGGSGPALAGAARQERAAATIRSVVSRRRGFALAASYSFGMAVVYTAFGVAAGLAGEGLAAALQNPWVLGAFALGLVALSLSMFGVYNLQLPSSISLPHQRRRRRTLPGGQVAGVFAMGGVSALIVSPCVAAPLAGALLYLSQTRDVWLGGTALFSLAAGMSVPLLLIGASAGALLPRAGAWMVEVKAAFGVLLLGVALWTVQPILPGPLALALWGLLALGAAGAAGHARRAPSRRHRVSPAAPPRLAWRQAIAALLGLVGVLQVVGAASGATDPLQPLARFSARSDIDASPGMPQFRARQERRRARRRAAYRRAPGDARFLRRLVRLVQGDGALHVHRPGGAEEARRRAASQGRRHREQRRRPRAAEALQPVRAAGNDLLRRERQGNSRRRA